MTNLTWDKRLAPFLHHMFVKSIKHTRSAITKKNENLCLWRSTYTTSDHLAERSSLLEIMLKPTFINM